MSETTPNDEKPAASLPPTETEPVPAPAEAELDAQAVAVMVAEGDAQGPELEADAAAEDAAAPAGSNEPGEISKGPANLSPAACAALLAQHFPALFGAGRALPIKLRVQADIQQRVPGVFNKKSLSIFLHRYTTSTAYLKALATQPQRLDLDGQPAGDIEALHRDAAAAEVERRKAMFEERRAAEREAQRQAAQEARRAQNAQNTARNAARDNAESEARRNRALLLRAFETTTLTRANFCALKGIVEGELDAQLVLARQEREQRALEPQRDQRPQGQRPPQGQRRPEGERRGPRPERRPQGGGGKSQG